MAKTWYHYGARFYIGLDLYPYQVAFGLTLRWFERRPHVRLYVGPVKLFFGGNFDA